MHLLSSFSLNLPFYEHKKRPSYFSFIRPLLEYADVVWNNCTQYESNGLDKIQNVAARIVTGAN